MAGLVRWGNRCGGAFLSDEAEERNCAAACGEFLDVLPPHRRATAILLICRAYNMFAPVGPLTLTEGPH